MSATERIAELSSAIKARGRLVVLFSGGLDSALLAKLAHDALGDNAVALTIDSAVVPRSEFTASQRLAAEIGIRQHILSVEELELEHFKTNAADRCYDCRKSRDAAAWLWADSQGFTAIADGLNHTDLSDYRPGLKAATEDRIWHPFIEFKIGKEDIRALSRELGLSGWDRPSMACLASRFPHGYEVTPTRVSRVDGAEEFIRELGFVKVRVRHFPHNLALVEVDDTARAVEMRHQITAKLRELGFSFVSLNLEAFASGSMNKTADTEATD
ncbi:MAG: ATP-dependent sacrificial sulfur transferase LarE [Dehalococcoidia bacterium]|nr:ATP-dependent sacrificial sulfur transferase LarE [Dehalococcoidia bacterium]